MYKGYFRRLSIGLVLVACAAVGRLLFVDVTSQLQMNTSHQRAGAFALMAIGLAYVSAHLSMRSSRADFSKAVFIGSAFFLWGLEQLLPPSPWITLFDSVVVVIFVGDLGVSIIQQIRGKGDTIKESRLTSKTTGEHLG